MVREQGYVLLEVVDEGRAVRWYYHYSPGGPFCLIHILATSKYGLFPTQFTSPL